MSKLISWLFALYMISGVIIAYGAGEYWWSKNYAYAWMGTCILLFLYLQAKLKS